MAEDGEIPDTPLVAEELALHADHDSLVDLEEEIRKAAAEVEFSSKGMNLTQDICFT